MTQEQFQDLEIYSNDIELYLHEFCIKYNIDDLTKESQNRFNACLMYIQKNVFYNKDKLKLKTNISNSNSIMNSTYNCYDYDLIDNILDIYIALCNLYTKEISINGFSKLLGIPYSTIENWGNNYDKSDRINNKSLDIFKKLLKENEQSNSDLLSTTKNTIGIIARLNHVHNWNLPGVSKEVTSISTKSVDQLATEYNIQRIETKQ